ncbi:MAG: SCO family protein [Arenicellales bacterium]|nr:SCO family protein [Arenicellales bacterium]
MIDLRKRGKINISLIFVVFLVISYSGTTGSQGQIEIDTTMSAPFSLVDHDGQPTSDEDFRGRFMLVFFGYTSCPDVCPIHLQSISRAMESLGKVGEKVQPIFITIDPERDTENLKEYVTHFHPNMVGLSGTPKQVAAAAQAYGAYFVKVREGSSKDPQSYLINHTAYIYLLGTDGRFRTAFESGTSVDNLVAGILQHLDE